MKEFSVTISNSYGTSLLKISVEESNRTGVLTYENSYYPVSDCNKSSVSGGIIFWMHIGSIKLKARLYVQVYEEKNYITLITGNTPHHYIIPTEAREGFNAFDQDLQLPVVDQVFEGLAESVEWPEKLAFEIKKVHLSLFLTWMPPGDNHTIEFLSIRINNTEVNLSGAYYMSAQNGVIVPLGLFDTEAEYFVAWECRARKNASKTAVGVLKNNSLNSAVILVRKDNVSTMDKWADAGSINV